LLGGMRHFSILELPVERNSYCSRGNGYNNEEDYSARPNLRSVLFWFALDEIRSFGRFAFIVI